MLDEITRKTREGLRYTDTEITSSKTDPLMRELVLTGLYNFIFKYYNSILEEDRNKEDLIHEACAIAVRFYNDWKKNPNYPEEYSFYKVLVGTVFNRIPGVKHTKYGGLIQQPYVTKDSIRKALAKRNISCTEDEDLHQKWVDHIFCINSITPMSTPITRNNEEGENLCLEDTIRDTSNDFPMDRYYTKQEMQFTMRDFIASYKTKVDPVIYNTLQNMLDNKYISLRDEAKHANIFAEKEVRKFAQRVKHVIKRIATDFKNKGL